jgi:hypothetical protein
VTSKKISINSDQISHYRNKLEYEIDSWDLYKGIERGENIIVVDARSGESYKKEYIPNAISFPYSTMNKDSTLERLNFDTLYVTYCDGIGCNASTKGALKLAELGCKVKELMGGIDWWKRDGYATASSPSEDSSGPNCGCDG